MTGGVCVVGSINVDTTLRVPVLPGPGETVLSTGRHRSGGGKGANQAAAAAAVGARVALVAAVGQDEWGRSQRLALQERGIDVAHVETLPGPTGAAVILVAEDGENLIVVDPGVNAGLDPEVSAAAVAQLRPDVLLGQLEVPLAVLIAAARSRGEATFVLNPAPISGTRAELAAVIDAADVLVPNRNELATLVGLPPPASLSEVRACLAALDCRADVVVTLGSAGCLVRAGDQIVEMPPVPVDPVDTSGAGDVLCGVLAAELAGGRALLDAVGRANEVAAASTTIVGAQVPPDLVAPPPSQAVGGTDRS